MNELQTQIGIAIFVPYILQWMKSKAWLPIMSFDNSLLNRITSAVVAIVTGLGVGANYDAGTLTITGLTALGLWHGFLHSAYQFAMNHASYKTLIAPSLPGFQQAQIRDSAEAGTPVVPATKPDKGAA